MGPNHLISIGLTLEDLHPTTQSPIYGADGSSMLPAIGSVKVQLEVKGKGIQEWIHVHPNIPVPFLSYRACRELALIPEQITNTIVQVTHAEVQSGATERHSKDGNNPYASLPPPHFTCSTTPAQARSYYLKEYSDVLLKKTFRGPHYGLW